MNTAKTVHQLSAQATIGQIVTVSNSAESLLHSIGLKPEAHQEKTLRQVCTELKWNEEEVLEWIKRKNLPEKSEPGRQVENQHSVEEMTLTERFAFFLKTFHGGIHSLLNEVNATLPRVYKVHGIQEHSLKVLEQEFESFRKRLTMYLKFQKSRYFDRVKQFQKEKNEVSDGVVQELIKSIDVIRDDQRELNKSIDTFGRITDQFDLPEHACSTYRIMIRSLESLVKEVKELNTHIEKDVNRPILKELK